MKRFVSIFDELSYKPFIFVDGTSRHKTILPAIIGFMLFCVVLGLAGYFLQVVLSRNSPNIFYNDREDFYPEFNFSSFPISVGVSLGETTINDPTLFNIKTLHMRYETKTFPNGTTVNNNLFEEVPLAKCNKSDFIKYNASSIENTLCINPNTYNMSISGIYGDITKGNSYFNLFINRCTNITTFKMIDGINTTIVINSNNQTNQT